jgi:hypothetical protein
MTVWSPGTVALNITRSQAPLSRGWVSTTLTELDAREIALVELPLIPGTRIGLFRAILNHPVAPVA